MSVTIDINTLDYNKLRDEMDKMNEMFKKKEAEKSSTSTTTTTTTTADDQVKNLEKIQKTIKWSIIIIVIIIVVVIIIIIIYKVVTSRRYNYTHIPNQPVYRVQPPPTQQQPIYKVFQQPPPQPVYRVQQPPQQPVYRVQQPPQQLPPQQPPQQQLFESSTDNSEFTTDSTIWSSSDQTPKKINGGRKFKR